MDLFGLFYLFFRLSPFIIASFFSLISVFNSDLKGFIYLVGLILSTAVTMIFGTTFKSVFSDFPSGGSSSSSSSSKGSSSSFLNRIATVANSVKNVASPVTSVIAPPVNPVTSVIAPTVNPVTSVIAPANGPKSSFLSKIKSRLPNIKIPTVKETKDKFSSLFKKKEVVPIPTTAGGGGIPPVCNTLSLGGFSGFSKVPLSTAVLSYTFFYLVYTIGKNNMALYNIPTLILFPILILSDIGWNIQNGCYPLLACLMALVVAGGIGVLWSYIVSVHMPNMQYLIVGSNREMCMKPSDQTLICTED